MVKRLSDGENPVRVWREYRRMSLDDLAGMTGMSPALLIAIENGAQDEHILDLLALADALSIDIDDLFPWLPFGDNHLTPTSLARFLDKGPGWQTRLKEVLRKVLK
jgi:transcriptional regulator with XRE-family HTH domain